MTISPEVRNRILSWVEYVGVTATVAAGVFALWYAINSGQESSRAHEIEMQRTLADRVAERTVELMRGGK